MFEDNQTDQTNNNGAAGAAEAPAPAMSLGGMNPSPTYVAPSDSDTPAPAVVLPSQPITEQSMDAPAPSQPLPAAPVSGNLEEIKRNALQQLSPLVGKLDQSPEDKYKTLMMMIQASDNQELLAEAYDNAQKITDEKARAEALLSVVNEVNYFMQKSAQ